MGHGRAGNTGRQQALKVSSCSRKGALKAQHSPVDNPPISFVVEMLVVNHKAGVVPHVVLVLMKSQREQGVYASVATTEGYNLIRAEDCENLAKDIIVQSIKLW